MLLHNITPFPATAFRQLDPAGQFECVVASRGRFFLRLDAPMIASKHQPPLQWQAEYEGDPHGTPLLRSTDLTPFRPGTDVSFLGNAHAPDGVPTPVWTCGVRVADRLNRVLRVTGPRRWTSSAPTGAPRVLARRERRNAWRLTDPEPALSVPLDWRLAHGGPTLGLPDGMPPPPPLPDNPLGSGIIDPVHTACDRDYPAPQVELADSPAQSPDATPAGVGLVPPWWPRRLRYAGTYDTRWLETRHPLLPEDFDDRFWQAAAPGMVVEPWLQGDESFVLTNLHPDHPELSGFLPGLRMVVRVHLPQTAMQDRELALDSVQFDLRPGMAECHLTWRARFPLLDAQLAQLVLRATDMSYRRARRPEPLGAAV